MQVTNKKAITQKTSKRGQVGPWFVEQHKRILSTMNENEASLFGDILSQAALQKDEKIRYAHSRPILVTRRNLSNNLSSLSPEELHDILISVCTKAYLGGQHMCKMNQYTYKSLIVEADIFRMPDEEDYDCFLIVGRALDSMVHYLGLSRQSPHG